MENKIVISQHTIFLEKDMILKRDSGSQVELQEIPIEDSQKQDTQPVTRIDEASGSNSQNVFLT